MPSKNDYIKLLESKIDSLVRKIMTEDNTRRGSDNVVASQDYKRQYKAIEKYLDQPDVDATQVMAKALGFDPDDDAERSHAFKKLHRDPTADGTGRYKFDSSEIGKIFSQIS
jgi:hypothetical protein